MAGAAKVPSRYRVGSSARRSGAYTNICPGSEPDGLVSGAVLVSLFVLLLRRGIRPRDRQSMGRRPTDRRTVEEVRELSEALAFL
jgi:hypothetical protein